MDINLKSTSQPAPYKNKIFTPVHHLQNKNQFHSPITYIISVKYYANAAAGDSNHCQGITSSLSLLRNSLGVDGLPYPTGLSFTYSSVALKAYSDCTEQIKMVDKVRGQHCS